MNFKVEFKNNSVRIRKSSSQSNQVYRLPFDTLSKDKCAFDIKNPFIVYILFAHNPIGRDYIYVGKSKNGIFGRPKQHADKFQAEICFILTQEYKDTFFNDGAIQYLEDQINQRVNATHAFTNTTETTNKGTVNPSDEADCDDYLTEAYEMLKVIGLDLETEYEEENIQSGQGEEKTQSVPEKISAPELTEKEMALPISQLVHVAMKKLETAGYHFSDEQLMKYQDASYNHELFGKNTKFPFMKAYDPKDPHPTRIGKYVRFKKDIYTFNGKQFLVTKELYEKGDKDRKAFINWYKNL